MSFLKAFFAARKFVLLPKTREEDIKVIRAEPNGITFHPGQDAETFGKLSFRFDRGRGHAILAESVSHTSDGVYREVLKWQHSSAKRCRRGYFTGVLEEQPVFAGFSEFETANINSAGMQLPAWLHLGSDTWVIHVHGRTASRSESIRNLSAFEGYGFSHLLISLRNSSELKAKYTRLSHFGAQEWRDLKAAVDFAESHGANKVILFGISMGAVSIAEFLRKSSMHKLVDAVIIDSAVVSWVPVLTNLVVEAGHPAELVTEANHILKSKVLSKLLGLKTPVDVRTLGFTNWSEERFHLPILALHSVDDDYVPYEPVKELQLAHSNLVKLVTFSDTGHVRLYNHEPVRWVGAIRDFLGELGYSSE